MHLFSFCLFCHHFYFQLSAAREKYSRQGHGWYFCASVYRVVSSPRRSSHRALGDLGGSHRPPEQAWSYRASNTPYGLVLQDTWYAQAGGRLSCTVPIWVQVCVWDRRSDKTLPKLPPTRVASESQAPMWFFRGRSTEVVIERLLADLLQQQLKFDENRRVVTMLNPMRDNGEGRCRGGRAHVMHGRSRVAIGARIPAMSGRGTSGVHRPGRHCLH